jgi:hypothetical protein
MFKDISKCEMFKVGTNIFSSLWSIFYFLCSCVFEVFMPPFEEEGHIALHLSVGRYVGR